MNSISKSYAQFCVNFHISVCIRAIGKNGKKDLGVYFHRIEVEEHNYDITYEYCKNTVIVDVGRDLQLQGGALYLRELSEIKDLARCLFSILFIDTKNHNRSIYGDIRRYTE